MIDVAIAAFVTMFVVIEPIALAPLFVALTTGRTAAERRRIALRACIIAMILLTLFGVAGESVLAIIGIGMPAFRISGGLLLFMIAAQMLFERRNQSREPSLEDQTDPSVFPLATPLIAGPAALTSMVLLTGQQSGNWSGVLVVHGVVLAVVATAYVFSPGIWRVRLSNASSARPGPRSSIACLVSCWRRWRCSLSLTGLATLVWRDFE